ncbi:E3 ubiquitin-protein ligase TRIM9-like isoform X2 [Branchiostoma floridae]|uniref:E3 ubiquitin-protein ligase TRIM9-like isoform X2 n=1 Tax=Branchiostoma floridae TaxID=7739 RepID=A0A9J7KW01_BRAFL|nr:E3 ubiquitin-protein ligase TRIM9-like isoform X2 [Branchiostoma floridae]
MCFFHWLKHSAIYVLTVLYKAASYSLTFGSVGFVMILNTVDFHRHFISTRHFFQGKKSAEPETTVLQATETHTEGETDVLGEDVDTDSLEPDGEEVLVVSDEDEIEDDVADFELTNAPETTNTPETASTPETAKAPEEEEGVAKAEEDNPEDCKPNIPGSEEKCDGTSEEESNLPEGASTASSPHTDGESGNKTPTSDDIEGIKTNIAESQKYLKAALKVYEEDEGITVEETTQDTTALKADDKDEGIPEEGAMEGADVEDGGSDEEESDDDVTSFPCPTCRKNVEFERGRGLESLRRNITLENIIERYRELAKGTKRSPVLCDVCDADPPPKATKTCLTCQISYCDNCVRTTHPSNKKAFARHKLVEPQQAKRKVLTCPDHEDEKLNMFCCVDEMPICALCKLVGKHSEHKVAALAQMYRAKKESVADSVSRLEKELKELGAFVTKVKQSITELEMNSESLKSQLSLAIEELCGNLQNRREAMVKEVEQEKEVQLELLQVELATHEEQVKKMDALMMYAKEALKEEDHASFLQSVREVDGSPWTSRNPAGSLPCHQW